ncbi:hypothetical protein ACIBCB_18380 [Streptomyces uncialis]|uniref:hypothetical protein n=1 Tax=Streptomyces uncialis TaxID=1048205 RepID=UPI0037BA8A76
MSDANVVGRVAVKIMPDTAGFKDDLKDKLKRIERDLDVTVDARLDGEELGRQARSARRDAQRELKDLRLRVNLDGQDSVKRAIAQTRRALDTLRETVIEVDVNEASLQAAIDMFEERLDDIGTVSLQVDRNSESSVRAAVARLDRELERLAETELTVRLDRDALEEAKRNLVAESRAAAQQAADEIQAELDGIDIRPELDLAHVAKTKRELEAAFARMRELRAKITPELDALATRAVERDIEDLQERIDGLRAEIEPEVSRTGIAAVLAHMAVLARDRIVHLVPRVRLSAAATATAMLQALSGARVIGDMFERLGRTIKNLDKSVPIIGTMATAIAGLAGWGITAASNLFTLAASLAQIGYTALLLPGLLGGIAVGLGVTIAALKDFNKEVPEAKAALAGLQDAISDNFWEKAREPIRSLVEELLPQFRDGVEQTATQLGGFFGGLAKGLEGALVPALGQMFLDLSESIGIATAGTDTFASIITTLGKVGTSYLPELANWFVTVSEKFDAFLKRKGENGLKQEIDEGIEALQDLGSVLFHTGGILAGFARAAEAAGGSTLDMMAGTLERIHRTVDSPSFQSGLTQLFYAAHEAMREIATVSGPAVEEFFKTFGRLLTDILPQVGAIIGTALGAIASALSQSAVVDGVKALFDGIQSAVEALAPAMMPAGAALGTLLEIAGALAAILGPLAAAVLTPLAETFTLLGAAVLPLIGLLGDGLMGIVAALTPLLMTVVAAVVPLVEALVAGLAPIIPLITAAFAVMSEALQPVVEILMRILTAAILPLIPVVQSLAAEYLPQISAAFSAVMVAIQPLLEALESLVNFLMPILAPAIEFIAGLFLGALVGAINGVASVFTGLWSVFSGVWDMIVGLFKVVIGFFKGTLTGDWSMFSDGLKQIWNGIKSFLSGLWDVIKGLFMVFLNVGILGVGKKILAGVKSLWNDTWNGIKSFAIGLWDSIRGAAGVFMTGVRGYIDDGLNAIKGIWSSIWNSIKSFFSSTWDSIKSVAGTAMTSLRTAVSDGIGRVLTVLKSLPGKAKEALANLGSTLIGAGKKLIQGLIDGIKSMFGAVKGKLGELTDKLTDWKGPPKKDGRLLYDAGRLIISGLVKGLESQYDKVRQSLTELTAKIPKNASKGLKDRISRDRTDLLKLAAQWEAGSKRLEAARDKLDRLREEARDYAAQVADRVLATGDVTKVKDASFASITDSLKNAVEQAKKFAAVLAKLKKLGLNQATFDQIAMAGPEAGLAAAEAIANAGNSGVNEINQLQKELEKHANAAGATASKHMYEAGLAAAEGLVKGLEAKQAAIEKTMLKIANSMVAAIKKALDIRSPSRLLRRLGSFAGRGFGLGVEDETQRVERAGRALAHGAATGASGEITAAVSSGLTRPGATANQVSKVLNYYAGNASSSLSSEEELFAAASRARMVGW